MFEFNWEIDGRPVKLGKLGDEVAKMFLKAAHERIETAITEVRCSHHGTHPRITGRRQVGSEWHYEYETCCAD